MITYKKVLKTLVFILALLPLGWGVFANAQEKCGNNTIEGTEQCDDGNEITGDGCNEFCQLEIPTCNITVDSNTGNAPFVINATATNVEPWGNIIDIAFGDGKNAINTTNDKTTFTASNSYKNGGKYKPTATVQNNLPNIKLGTIRPTANCELEVTAIAECGDGELNSPREQCDDGNKDNGDGCSYNCQLEIPSCKLDIPKNSGSSPLSTTVNLSKNQSRSNFISLDFNDGGAPITSGIKDSNAHTFNCNNNGNDGNFCNVKAIIKSTYNGKKQDGLKLPEGQCGGHVGTFRYKEVDKKERAEIAFVGTCFGKEPVMVIRGIENINDLSDPKLDRRYFNNFKFETAYSGCYSVNEMNVVGVLNNGQTINSDPIPDNTTEITPPRVISVDFPNSNMEDEDRITNPKIKDLNMNIGYKHHKDNSINGDYTILQERINDIYPFEGDDGQLGLKLIDNREQEYITNIIDKTLYPYCYVFPKLKLISSDGRNKKDLTFKYLGCDPLKDITIDFHIDEYEGKENVKTGTKHYSYEDPNNSNYNEKIHIKDKLNGTVCIENDLDGDGIMCNSSADKNAIGAFEDFTVTLDLPNEMMVDFDKQDFLTKYLFNITKDTDKGKDLDLSLYNEILGKEPRIHTTTGDFDPTNDTKPSTHNIIGFKGYFDVPYKPGININEFKVIFAKADEKEFIQQNGLLKINYDNIDIVDNFHGINYKPYGILKVYDPFGNEIEIMGKRIDFVPDNSYNENNKLNIIQYIPMIMDTTYPNGIYTVKLEIFDKFNHKIDKDQYTSFFKSNSVPQISAYLKEKPNSIADKIKIFENFNNGYLIDFEDYKSNSLAYVRIFLHKELKELKKVNHNGITSLVIRMNNKKVYVPVTEVKQDEITGLKYIDLNVRNTPNKGVEGRLIGNAINTVEILDIYGEGNLGKNSFNVMLLENTTARAPMLKEDYNDYLLKIKNVFNAKTNIPVVNGIKDGIPASKINFFNNNIWFKIGNEIYIKDFSNNIVSVLDSDGWDKIKMNESGIIRTKNSLLNIPSTNTNISLTSAVTMDYDIKRNIGFALTDNGGLKVFNNSGYKNKGEDIFKFKIDGNENVQALSIFYIPTNNSYELFIIVNKTLYILNYNLENNIISKDYGPTDEGYTNSLLETDLLDLDIKPSFEKLNIFVLTNKPDRTVKIISLPFIKYKDQYVKEGMPINFYINSTIPMSYYKQKILPRVQLSHKQDIVSDEQYMKMTIDVHNKKRNTINAYLEFGDSNVSDNATIESDNFAGFDKYEIYSDGNKVADKELINTYEKSGRPVEVNVPFNGSTNTYIVKGINKKFGTPVSTIVPVINYLFSMNLSGGTENRVEITTPKGEKIIEPILYDDGKYTNVSISFFDKRGREIRSYSNQEVLIINNKVYSYIPIYMNKTSSSGAGEMNYFDFLEGGYIKILFNYKGKVLDFKIPFNTRILTKYSVFTKNLINKKGETIDFTNLVEKKDVKMLEDYVRSIPKEFVNTQNFVRREFVDNVENWDMSNYDQLMICINKNDVDDLTYKLKEIYPILEKDIAVINKNKIDEREYLQKRFEEKIKRLKETKLKTSNMCIQVSDIIH